MRKPKLTPDSEVSGQKAINLIEQVVLDAGLLWHPAGPFDAGIDGRIELRDTRTAEPLNRHLGVQSKGWAKFTAETDASFEFLCESADIDYWMRSDDPVLLVCSHPASREAWFVCVSDWFADAERRVGRRVTFDKTEDRFEASKAVELMRLGSRAEPVLHRRPVAPPEELLTNLLPVSSQGSRLWNAPTDLFKPAQAHARYTEAGGPRASDYLLRDSRLFSLRDPRTCPLRHLCDASQAEDFPAEGWAQTGDPKLTRYWVELLRRAMIQQFKQQFQWNPSRGVFYIPAPEALTDLSIEGPNGKRMVVKVERYLDKRTNVERIKYVRHHAFRPGFQQLDGRWHLEVEPDYLFTSDGERACFRADEYLAGIKKLEKNLAVVGHLRMWEYLLTRPPSLLEPEPGLLLFGELLTVEASIGINDDEWRGKETTRSNGPTNQEELAA